MRVIKKRLRLCTVTLEYVPVPAPLPRLPALVPATMRVGVKCQHLAADMRLEDVHLVQYLLVVMLHSSKGLMHLSMYACMEHAWSIRCWHTNNTHYTFKYPEAEELQLCSNCRTCCQNAMASRGGHGELETENLFEVMEKVSRT